MENRRNEPNLKLINMEQVEIEKIDWLLYPFIPFAKVTIVQGDPGEGKTTMVLQIIAKLTKGEAVLPSDSDESALEEKTMVLEPVNVIYQTAEDGLGDTIKPRLLSAGADCSRVMVIDDGDQALTMEEFRSVMADRFVLTLINKKIMKPEYFIKKENGAVIMNDEGRKVFLSAWQSKKQETIKHPFLGEKIEWGMAPYVQSLLLARFLRGDLDEYPPFFWK